MQRFADHRQGASGCSIAHLPTLGIRKSAGLCTTDRKRVAAHLLICPRLKTHAPPTGSKWLLNCSFANAWKSKVGRLVHHRQEASGCSIAHLSTLGSRKSAGLCTTDREQVAAHLLICPRSKTHAPPTGSKWLLNCSFAHVWKSKVGRLVHHRQEASGCSPAHLPTLKSSCITDRKRVAAQLLICPRLVVESRQARAPTTGSEWLLTCSFAHARKLMHHRQEASGCSIAHLPTLGSCKSAGLCTTDRERVAAHLLICPRSKTHAPLTGSKWLLNCSFAHAWKL
jgi:hypothetical protein